MINDRVVGAALSVAAIAIAIGATINTADWLSCSRNHGGNACVESLNRATSAWVAFGMNALALATNVLKQEDND